MPNTTSAMRTLSKSIHKRSSTQDSSIFASFFAVLFPSLTSALQSRKQFIPGYQRQSSWVERAPWWWMLLLACGRLERRQRQRGKIWREQKACTRGAYLFFRVFVLATDHLVIALFATLFCENDHEGCVNTRTCYLLLCIGLWPARNDFAGHQDVELCKATTAHGASGGCAWQASR